MGGKQVYQKGENGQDDRYSVWCMSGIALEEVCQL